MEVGRRVSFPRGSRWPRVTKHAANGWSWGCVATVDREGQTIFVADAHRGDGQRFVVHADEKLTAFLELDSAILGVRKCAGRSQASTAHYASAHERRLPNREVLFIL
jgi:hypothetical protein